MLCFSSIPSCCSLESNWLQRLGPQTADTASSETFIEEIERQRLGGCSHWPLTGCWGSTPPSFWSPCEQHSLPCARTHGLRLHRCKATKGLKPLKLQIQVDLPFFKVDYLREFVTATERWYTAASFLPELHYFWATEGMLVIVCFSNSLGKVSRNSGQNMEACVPLLPFPMEAWSIMLKFDQLILSALDLLTCLFNKGILK